jgi:hypothetical protein
LNFGIHGHGDANFVQRNLVEQHLHVLDRIDRHAGLAHVAGHAGMVAVIAPVRGQVKGDRHALAAGGQRLAVESVGFFCCRKACVLADRPGAHSVHRGLRAAQEGLEARQRIGVRQAPRVLGGVQGLDDDAVRRDPVQGIDLPTGGGFRSGFGPGFEADRGEFGVV